MAVRTMMDVTEKVLRKCRGLRQVGVVCLVCVPPSCLFVETKTKLFLLGSWCLLLCSEQYSPTNYRHSRLFWGRGASEQVVGSTVTHFAINVA